jgi:hypothetical protein
LKSKGRLGWSREGSDWARAGVVSSGIRLGKGGGFLRREEGLSHREMSSAAHKI